MGARFAKLLLIFVALLCGVAISGAQDYPGPGVQQNAAPDLQDNSGAQNMAVPGGQGNSGGQNAAAPGVARLSAINGGVSIQRGDAGEWTAGSLNTPLESGDSISTAQDARAEVQLDYADILRLAGSADAKIATLDNGQIQVEINQGLVDFTVLKGSQGQVEIDTPNIAIRPSEPGVYRVEVDSQSETRITVRKGKAEVSTQQGSAELDQGRMMMVEGDENPQYQITDAQGEDDWDRWNKDRNHQIESAQSWRYDNSYYTGTADLDNHGHWVDVPGYDWCWTPYVDAGWIPYSAGSWDWQPYYGWTWVSREPWGWAPYHYGRWFSWRGSWMWWPGPVTPYYRPIWAPAYVSFFGFGGGHFGFGVGFGSGFGYGRVGWLPIGPCDSFYPWYGRGHFGYRITRFGDWDRHDFGNRRGMPYIGPLAGRGRPVYSNLRAALRDPHVRGGIVSVPSNRFGTAEAFRARTRGLSGAEFRQASFVSGRVPIVPTRASLSPTGRAASRRSLPSAAVANRRFYASRQPAGRTQSFSQQAARMQEMVRHNPAASTSFGRAGSQQFGRGQANSVGRTSRAASSYGAANNGWRSFGSRTPSMAGRTYRAGSPAGRGSFNNSRSLSPSAHTGGRQSSRSFSNGGRSASPPRNFSDGGRNMSAPRNFNDRMPSSRSFGGRAQQQSRGNWQQFNSHTAPFGGNSVPRGRRNYSQPNGGWRGFSGGGGKPPLELNRPIVTGRSRNYQGSWGGGYYRAPSRGSYNGSSRSSSYGRSAPSYSRGGGGGFSRGGGGGYRGGGGGGGYHGGGGGGSRGGGGGGSRGGGGGHGGRR
ncbi:MAG: DUF6600 domain-containing protein [Terriglobia bacterium]